MILDLRTDIEIENEIAEYKKAYTGLYLAVFLLFSKLYALKSAAFQEEQEWRLMSYSLQDDHDSCSYRAVNNCLIPYKVFDLIDLKKEPIVEVIIAPKNMTPVYVIEGFLKTHGFNNVKVLRSKATYR